MVLLSGGHLRRVIRQGIIFVASAAVTSTAAYALIGGAGALFPFSSRRLFDLALMIGCGWALSWYVYPARRLLPSPTKQLNRRYVEVPLAGAAVFGGVLGIGLLTPVVTPLVWGGALSVFASGSTATGAVYGVSFAIGRCIPLVGQRFLTSHRGPDIVAQVVGRYRRYRAAGTAVCLCVLAAGATHLLGPL